MFGVTFSRIEAEIVGVLLLVAFALLGLGFWLHEHDADISRAATAPILAAEQAASAAETLKAAQVDAAQAENRHEAIAQNAAAQTNRLALAADVQRMRDDAVRPRSPAQAPGLAPGGDPGEFGLAGLVPERLLRAALAARAGAESDAADLSVSVGVLSRKVALCTKDYAAAQ